jgi:hypothetical protein
LNDFFRLLEKNPVPLEFLNLSALKSLGPETLKILGASLKTMEQLTNLDISRNSIGSDVIRGFLELFNANKTVRYLNLSWNALHCIDFRTCKVLQRVLQDHKALMHLDLSYTHLCHEEMLLVMNGAADSRAVQSVHLTGNNVPSSTKAAIRAAINCTPFAVEYLNKPMKVLTDISKLTAGTRKSGPVHHTDNPSTIADVAASLHQSQSQGLVNIAVPILSMNDPNPWNETRYEQRHLVRNMLVGLDRVVKKPSVWKHSDNDPEQHIHNLFKAVMKKGSKATISDILTHDPLASELKPQLAKEQPLVYFRFLEDDIAKSNFWKEYDRCWVCERWRKIEVKNSRAVPQTLVFSVMAIMQSPQERNMYLYASFTNWKPRPLKFDEESNAFKHVEYLPPGNHFYLFSGRNNQVFSEELVAERGASLFVKPRDTEVPIVVLQKPERKVRRRKFLKRESLFRDYIEDTPETLRKIFENDFKNSKYNRLIKKKEDLNEVKELLWSKYYRMLKRSFQYYGSTSVSYPYISLLEFGKICKDTGIADANLPQRDIDRAFVATNFEVEDQQDNPDSMLCRFEFLEIMYRLAMLRFKVDKNVPNPAALLQRFMDECIGDKFQTGEKECEQFRREKVFTLGVNYVLTQNLAVMEAAFKKYRDNTDPFMTFKMSQIFLKDMKLQLHPKIITQCFAFSKMTVQDEANQNNKNAYDKLLFVEFLEFFVRISDQLFKDPTGSQPDPPIHIKVDLLVEILANLLGLKKAEFEDDQDFYEDTNEEDDENARPRDDF